jgi:hypothetical protein
MATTTPAAPAQDPSLAALVPRPSPWRHAAVAVVALALLVTVGVVGVRTRITLADSGGGGQVVPDGRILEEHNVVATGWPGLTASSVTPSPGTRLLGAWLVPRSARLAASDASVATLVDSLERDGAEYRLPRPVEPGLEYLLVLSSEVLSCDALATGTHPGFAYSSSVPTAGLPPDPSAPTVHLSTALGTELDAAVFWSGWTRDTLETYGSCPD